MMVRLSWRTGIFVAIAVLPPAQASAEKLNVITSFSGNNGATPRGSLVTDAAGNFYGTTYGGGGGSSNGTVFELTPPEPGQTNWTETVLIAFKANKGENPSGSLIADSAGNFYGTTMNGGTSGYGTAFEVMPPAAGQTTWTENVLTAFNNTNGAYPMGSLVADNAGNLYGTTSGGGDTQSCTGGCGTVFKLAPPGAGKKAWTETVLIAFNGANGDGPQGDLIIDGAGNLYGMTELGGANGFGTVFKLAPPAAGQTAWTETILSSFGGNDGEFPRGSLIADQAGNLYGETTQGGVNAYGTVFELAPPAAGQTAWTFTVLNAFNGSDGANAHGSLIADGAGNFYGTTFSGGAHNIGTVFKLAPPAAGQTAWTETVLTAFVRKNGQYPAGSLIADSAGNLYGTAEYGGASKCHCGTVFEITP
jgi:uncharacterized repeat protein (TIGR03803 family)